MSCFSWFFGSTLNRRFERGGRGGGGGSSSTYVVEKTVSNTPSTQVGQLSGPGAVGISSSVQSSDDQVLINPESSSPVTQRFGRFYASSDSLAAYLYSDPSFSSSGLLWSGKEWSVSDVYSTGTLVLIRETSLIQNVYLCLSDIVIPSALPPAEDPIRWVLLAKVGSVNSSFSSSSSLTYNWKGQTPSFPSNTPASSQVRFIYSSTDGQVFLTRPSLVPNTPITGEPSQNSTQFERLSIGCRDKGVWQNGTVYFLGDIVSTLQGAYRVVNPTRLGVLTDPLSLSGTDDWDPLISSVSIRSLFVYRGTWDNTLVYQSNDIVVFGGALFVFQPSSSSSLMGLTYPSDFSKRTTQENDVLTSTSILDSIWKPFHIALASITSNDISSVRSAAPLQLAGIWNPGNHYELHHLVLFPSAKYECGFALFLYNCVIPSSRIDPTLNSLTPMVSLTMGTRYTANQNVWWEILPQDRLPCFWTRPAPVAPLYYKDFSRGGNGNFTSNLSMPVVIAGSSLTAKTFFASSNVLSQLPGWTTFLQTLQGQEGVARLTGNKYNSGMNNIALTLQDTLSTLFRGRFLPNGIQSISNVNGWSVAPMQNYSFYSQPFLTWYQGVWCLATGFVTLEKRSSVVVYPANSTRERLATTWAWTEPDTSTYTLIFHADYYPLSLFASSYAMLESEQDHRQETVRLTLPRYGSGSDTSGIQSFHHLLLSIQLLTPSTRSTVAVADPPNVVLNRTLPGWCYEPVQRTRLLSYLTDVHWRHVAWNVTSNTMFTSYDYLFATMMTSQSAEADYLLSMCGRLFDASVASVTPLFDYLNPDQHGSITVDGQITLGSPVNIDLSDTVRFPVYTASSVYPTRLFIPDTPLPINRSAMGLDLWNALVYVGLQRDASYDTNNTYQTKLQVAPYLTFSKISSLISSLSYQSELFFNQRSNLDVSRFIMLEKIFGALAIGSLKHYSPSQYQTIRSMSTFSNTTFTVEDVLNQFIFGATDYHVYASVVNSSQCLIRLTNANPIRDDSSMSHTAQLTVVLSPLLFQSYSFLHPSQNNVIPIDYSSSFMTVDGTNIIRF